ncbi:MAG: hypothetical protein ACXADC_11480 [Candidatus Thorarchaeota archaeon]|jgi:hypothetical protein
MKASRGIYALVIVLVVIVAGTLIFLSDFTPQVAPPDEPPFGDVDPVTVDGFQLSVTAYFWQDFMPAVPPEGPPFYLVLRVNATNLGNTTVFGLNVFTVTVYFGDSVNMLHTFKIEPGLACCYDEFTVAPDTSELFQFTNDRETIFSPDLEEGIDLYARVHVVWDNGEAIITTKPSPLGFTY